MKGKLEKQSPPGNLVFRQNKMKKILFQKSSFEFCFTDKFLGCVFIKPLYVVNNIIYDQIIDTSDNLLFRQNILKKNLFQQSNFVFCFTDKFLDYVIINPF